MDGPAWEPPDFYVTTSCAIEGCFTNVIGDYRCSEHGGQPEMESASDIWGREQFVYHDKEGATK